MSSEEQTALASHAEALNKPSRQRRTPKHLDDYLIDCSHRRGSSSQPAVDASEDQRGAAAAVSMTSQMQTYLRKDGHPNTSPTDSMSMSSLRELLKSMSDKEKDEVADMAALQRQLKHYEQRRRRRKELMEHITSFLREEGEEHQGVNLAMKPTRSPPEMSLCSPLSSRHSSPPQSPHSDLHTNQNACATPVGARKPMVEDSNPDFVPIQPASPFPIYTPVSSGSLHSLWPAQQHATGGGTVPLMRTELQDISGGGFQCSNRYRLQYQPFSPSTCPTFIHQLHSLYKGMAQLQS
ncbi:uncharacterized protein LOC124386849 [Tachysurus ichikawai]